MKSNRNRKSKGSTRMIMSLRLTQKQNMRYVVMGASIVSLLAVLTFYFTFFNNDSIHAENLQSKNFPTYTSTELIIPARLLLKPAANAKTFAGTNYKNDTNYIAHKDGRGQIISIDQYIKE